MRMPKCVLLLASTVLASSEIFGQTPTFPTKPIVIVHPTTPGSSGDVYYQAYTRAITANTGWKFIADYKPGAGGTIAPAYVAKSTPDGHTLMLVASTFTSTPLTQPDLPYDTVKS